MITIVNYRERYHSDIEAMDPEMAAEIARHADVCRVAWRFRMGISREPG